MFDMLTMAGGDLQQRSHAPTQPSSPYPALSTGTSSAAAEELPSEGTYFSEGDEELYRSFAPTRQALPQQQQQPPPQQFEFINPANNVYHPQQQHLLPPPPPTRAVLTTTLPPLGSGFLGTKQATGRAYSPHATVASNDGIPCRDARCTHYVANGGDGAVERERNPAMQQAPPQPRQHSYYFLYNIMGRFIAKMLTNVVEFFLQLAGFIHQAPGYQVPLILLVVFLSSYGAYSIMIQLFYILAALIALMADWCWPLIQLLLYSVTFLFRWLGCWVERVEELGESMMCDWAQLWCDEFSLMCHRRCGFVAKVLAKGRGVRCGT